ncbi:diketogulonate reductase-like aldo/keto reductase [Scopulibacillus darangshiensis]|uniref:Diketogulonate reductase-like aldo/keto reductase n=1 Tax=Scopulibacillus darangshiensis TaxID=442528 RepID=A0A4R2P4P1_9BACL|nr:aldo/keto reductase [Scopulibacillus darangshiensis]TCP28725.1 diketogulonate reductase-like aldo/keto reductase [Scopulibacillus darangshiensis]
MVKSLIEGATLHNGVNMPWLGLGVWKMANDEEVMTAVKGALGAGYRSIDTAAVYKNEEGVGKAIKQSDVPRDDIFLTTKVWNSDQGYDSTLEAFEASCQRLGVDYLDLYLVHWPVEGKYKETWRALEKLYTDGKVRAVGVCNFHTHHLKDLLAESKIKPMVNQVECHPLLNQKELHDFCRAEGIQLEAWSPLGQGHLLEDPTIKDIASKYGKTPAQAIIRWDLQRGIVTIPKSSNPNRIGQNGDVFDFELSKEDMDHIDALNKNERYGPDPDHFDF